MCLQGLGLGLSPLLQNQCDLFGKCNSAYLPVICYSHADLLSEWVGSKRGKVHVDTRSFYNVTRKDISFKSWSGQNPEFLGKLKIALHTLIPLVILI